MKRYLVLFFLFLIGLFSWFGNPFVYFAGVSQVPEIPNESESLSPVYPASGPVSSVTSVSSSVLPAPSTQISSASSDFSSRIPDSPVRSQSVAATESPSVNDSRISPIPASSVRTAETTGSSVSGGGQRIEFNPGKNAQPASSAETVSSNVPDVADESVKVPLVLQDPSSDMKLTDEQKADFQNLQDKFVEDVGGLEQNPQDPAYKEKWVAAQEESDEKFRSLFGWQALSQFHPGQDTQAPKP